MKRIAYLLIVILTMFCLPSCVPDPSAGNYSDVLTVKTLSTEAELTVYQGEIPFSELMEICGVKLNWESTDSAVFTANGKDYRLVLSEKTLKEIGGEKNLLTPPLEIANSRITTYSQNLERELYLDPETTNYVLQLLGFSGKNQVVILAPESMKRWDRTRAHTITTDTVPVRKARVFPLDGAGDGTVITVSNEEIPLTQVLTASGVKIHWIAEDTAEFSLDEKLYQMIPSECAIYPIENGEVNLSKNKLFVPWYLENSFLFSLDGEIYMDITLTNILLQFFDNIRDYTIVTWED